MQAQTFIKKGDIPMLYILRAIYDDSQLLRNDKCTKLFLFKKWHKTQINATNCPQTVAMAAPLIPHFKLKMKIGARTIFTTTDIKAEIIAFLG